MSYSVYRLFSACSSVWRARWSIIRFVGPITLALMVASATMTPFASFAALAPRIAWAASTSDQVSLVSLNPVIPHHPHTATTPTTPTTTGLRARHVTLLRQTTHPKAPPTPPGSPGPRGLAPEFCATTIPAWVWNANYRYAWTPPPGCYGGIWSPNPANYVARGGFGWCNWWAEVLRPDEPTLLQGNAGLTISYTPRVGATMIFPGGVDGASWAGHYAHLEAISPDGHYALISEMNFSWRGSGFGRVDYRFVALGQGIRYVY